MPTILGELETLDLILAGRSIARYGDGELKMADHACSLKSQAYDVELQGRLLEILADRSRAGRCLIGVPKLSMASPKYEHWLKHERYQSLFADGREYGSAFVTRPDSAPWINTPEYWQKVESLWVGQDITLVRGSSKSLCAEDLVGARTITEIIGPRQHAWTQYQSLLERIGRPARAILCLGATATVMAVDLCARGVHAIDFGHIGMFLRKYRRGEPMWVEESDKVAI